MSTATLNGSRATHARVEIPSHGIWWAEVSLDTEVTLSGAATLVIADLTLRGTIMSGGPTHGKSHYRIAAGAGGWGSMLPAKAYANDAGVKLSTVVGDAAREAGETVADLPTTRLGPSYVRESAPAARALEALAPAAWYVGEDGTTRLGRRAAADLNVEAQLGDFDTANSTQPLTATAIATIVPGIRVNGLEAVDVQHEVTPEGLRSTLWFGETSRKIAALRRVVLAALPDYRFRGVYEYRIATVEGERLNLQPIRSSLGMPDLRRVFVRPGVPGFKATHTLGARVLVGFVDADRSRPVVLSFEDADGAGFIPGGLTLAAGSTGAYPSEHVASLEGIINLLNQIVIQIGTQNAGLLTGAGLAALWTAIVNAALPLAGAPTGDITPFAAAIVAALAAKLPNATGVLPGVGWPNVKGA